MSYKHSAFDNVARHQHHECRCDQNSIFAFAHLRCRPLLFVSMFLREVVLTCLSPTRDTYLVTVWKNHKVRATDDPSSADLTLLRLQSPVLWAKRYPLEHPLDRFVTMPTTSTITLTTSKGTSTHVISLTTGITAAFFWCTVVGFVLYIVAFSTTGWYLQTGPQTYHVGLWDSCTCGKWDAFEKSWFHATRAMMTIGLIGFILITVLGGVYMFLHSINKNLVIRAFTVLCFASVLFMLIGVIVFGSRIGAYRGNVSYSYVFAIFSTMLCFAAGVLAAFQIYRSGSGTVTT
ncbi:hypothetical protein LSAT2_018222 [Lamellibrachia satsuma]|nr:hypothetical protein LSAT2_018222 [Lamellibrachia satsuma]